MAIFFDESVPVKWRRIATAVLMFYAAALAPLVIYAPKVMDVTSMDFTPPHGSPSYKAQQVLMDNFVDVATTNQIVIVITGPNISNSSVVRAYEQYVANEVVNYQNEHPDEWPASVEYCTIGAFAVNGNSSLCALAHIVYEKSRLLPQEDGVSLTEEQDRLISKNDEMTFITMAFTGQTQSSGLTSTSAHCLVNFAKHVKNVMVPAIEVNNTAEAKYVARATGVEMLNIDGMEGSVKDMEKCDMIVMPIAFAIFAYYVKSVRLLLIPMLTMFVSIATAFALVYPVALHTSLQLLTVVPQTMLSCCFAIGLDYNLFILMRWREGVDNGFPIMQTLRSIVANTCGHTIAVSGVVISLAWFGLCLTPAKPLVAMGIGCGMAVMAVVLVNVTLTPAVLCVFAGFFKVRTSFDPRTWCRKEVKAPDADAAIPKKGSEEALLNDDAVNVTQFEEAADDEAMRTSRIEMQKNDIWYRIAKFVERYPVVVIVAVLALGAPFYVQVPRVRTSLDDFEFVPRDSASAVAWRDLGKNFQPGMMLPFYILIAIKGSPGMQSEVVIDELVEFTNTVKTQTVLANYPNPNNHIQSIVQWMPTAIVGTSNTNLTCSPVEGEAWDGVVSWDYLHNNETGLLVMDSDFEPEERRRACIAAYFWLNELLVSDKNATLMTLITPFQPMGPVSTKFMDQLFDIIDNFEAEYPRYTISVSGGNTVSRDYNRIIDRSMLPMIGCIVAVVCVIVCLAFRSIAIPLRMAVTISYTVAVSFGVAYYAFQTSAFHWMFPYLKDYEGDALMWVVPSMAVSITVALGMDYDVFLLTRVYEMKIEHGYCTSASIIKGMVRTGPIITGAGIIMAVAFSALIMSSTIALNQFGLILCVSVLLDTFIVRTLFVPATMFLIGEANWFPRAMPKALHNEEDFVDELTAE